MNCATAGERLPWLLNGTLEEGERSEVLAHLEGCGGCKAELEETALAWAVYGQHAPAAELVAWACGDELGEGERQVIESHLRSCAACREEAELVRQSGAPEAAREAAGEAVPRRPPGVAPGWRWGALAAGLAAAVGLAGWGWTRQLQHQAGRSVARLAGANEELRSTVAEQGRELAGIREELARLQERLGALAAPRLNAPVVELVPSGVTLRGAPQAPPGVALPAEAPAVTLILLSEVRGAFEGYAVEVRGAGGAPLWRGEGLSRRATGEFTLQLPTELLPPPRVDLVVQGRRGERWVELETFSLETGRR